MKRTYHEPNLIKRSLLVAITANDPFSPVLDNNNEENKEENQGQPV